MHTKDKIYFFDLFIGKNLSFDYNLLYRDLQRALLGSFYYIFEKRKQQERIQKE